MYLTMYFAMYSPLPQNTPAIPHAPARPRRQAPQVTRIWLPDEPRPDRSLDILIWSILLLSLASAILLRDPFLLLLALTLLLGACALALLDALLRWEARDAGRAIARAVRALSRGEHLRYAIDGLGALELRGRPRIYPSPDEVPRTTPRRHRSRSRAGSWTPVPPAASGAAAPP